MAFEIRHFGTELRKFRETQNLAEYEINHPEWRAIVDNFAKKLDVKSPRLIRVPTKFVNAFLSVDGDVFVSDGLMKMLDCSHLSAPSKPMQATLAHEMGHMKFDMRHLKDMRLLPVTILKHTLWLSIPAAAMVAYNLYEQASKSLDSKSMTSVEQHKNILEKSDQIMDEERAGKTQSVLPYNPDYATWLTHNMNIGRTLLAGALGLGIGIAAHKFQGRMVEFRADRVAVELMGEVDSFNVLRDRFPVEASKVWHEVNTTPVATSFFERLEKYLKTEKYFLKAKMLGSHPSWQERGEKAAKHLARIEKEREKSVFLSDAIYR